ncbi:putative Zn-dependent hydrolase of beta-lactamase fold protein [Halovivax ruber XH-70]|uniref:Putative Zn-dependent hydrolase of beta-lactamase fold protein n=1 Tax=Halovivax ruber (strain DSM 18193 / JCM 13892 / XH-70) TaxID=797302 RepID=L0ICL3_HALRX|nr:MBL fold metallo-hydrolase [Halovivax ruber]AGB15966.1 putative Zn-dependent hydrolase of beta-lactamase fold protein [Halovivax ruber XH-70]
MTESDWGDWLVREIESTEPEDLSLWYLGCNGFVVKAADGTTIAIDPYVGLGDPPRTVRMIPVPFDPADFREMDAILATHEHTDHVHGPTQAPIMAETGATFYGPDASVEVALSDESWPDEWDVSSTQFETISPGHSFDVGSISVTVEEVNDPDADAPVGFVIESGGTTVFHAGDSRPADSFDRIGESSDIDLGILAFGSVGMIPDKQTREPKRTRWYNDENQIVRAASALQVDSLLPTHWDMWRGLTADPTALTHHIGSFDYPRRLELARIGDRIEL